MGLGPWRLLVVIVLGVHPVVSEGPAGDACEEERTRWRRSMADSEKSLHAAQARAEQARERAEAAAARESEVRTKLRACNDELHGGNTARLRNELKAAYDERLQKELHVEVARLKKSYAADLYEATRILQKRAWQMGEEAKTAKQRQKEAEEKLARRVTGDDHRQAVHRAERFARDADISERARVAVEEKHRRLMAENAERERQLLARAEEAERRAAEAAGHAEELRRRLEEAEARRGRDPEPGDACENCSGAGPGKEEQSANGFAQAKLSQGIGGAEAVCAAAPSAGAPFVQPGGARPSRPLEVLGSLVGRWIGG